ncbi:MAG TPA: hypothetical protein VJS63_10200 [Bradyrhizobium sp.]|nr:hypothetical protein [Bradyrhizobium sp.]
MVDLQRSIGCIWNIVRSGTQGGRGNSDADASAESVSSEKFSPPESGENIIRPDLIQIAPNQ